MLVYYFPHLKDLYIAAASDRPHSLFYLALILRVFNKFWVNQ